MEKASSQIRNYLSQRSAITHFIFNFTLVNIVIFWLVNLRYLTIIFSSDTLFQTTFYTYHTFGGKLVVCLFIFLTYIGHFALLAATPLLFFLPLHLCCRNQSWILLIAVFSWTLLMLALLADQVIFSAFHFHISIELLRLVSSKEYGLIHFLELSGKEVTLIAIIGFSILLFEFLLAQLLWHRKFFFLAKNALYYSYSLLLLCLFFSYSASLLSLAKSDNVFAQQTPVLPFYNDILASLLPGKNSNYLLNVYSETHFGQPLYPAAPLQYPLHSLHCQLHKKPLNIVIIGIDAWRFDAMNAVLTLHIAQIAQHAWQFKQHFSGGNATQPGLFSLFYSLPSSYWSSMMKEKQGALLIHQLLQDHYQTKIFFSADMIPPFHKNIFIEVKDLRLGYPAGKTIPDHDRSITNEFIDFMQHRDTAKPFFVFLMYDSVHGYYNRQNFTNKLYPTPEEGGQRLLALDQQAKMQEAIYRYRNAVHFVDQEVNKVWGYLQQHQLLENTVVLITADHGEELGDNQQKYWGHGSNYTKYQVQVPFILYQPRTTPRQITYQTTHYDIAPFLLHDILQCRNPSSDYSIGENLFTPHQRPYILAGSYLNMGIIEKNHNTTLFTSGKMQVQDNHANLLYTAQPDLHILAQALADMRRYYSSR